VLGSYQKNSVAAVAAQSYFEYCGQLDIFITGEITAGALCPRVQIYRFAVMPASVMAGRQPAAAIQLNLSMTQYP
jgi:hypothetical protein